MSENGTTTEDSILSTPMTITEYDVTFKIEYIVICTFLGGGLVVGLTTFFCFKLRRKRRAKPSNEMELKRRGKTSFSEEEIEDIGPAGPSSAVGDEVTDSDVSEELFSLRRRSRESTPQ